MVSAFTFVRKNYSIGYIFIFLFYSSSNLSAQNDLKYYIEQAKAFSPINKDVRNQSKINLLETERLRAQYLKPQITFNAGYTFAPILLYDNNKTRIDLNSQSSSSDYLGLDLGSTNGGNYQALFTVIQPIWAAKKFTPIADQLLVNNKINENNIELMQHDIEKNVIDQYINCLLDLKQADYISSIIKLIDEQRNIVLKLAAAALAKESDVMLLNIERQKQVINLTTFQNNYRLHFLDLNVLCGINDTTVQILTPLDSTSSVGRWKLEKQNSNIQSQTSNVRFLEKYRLDSLNALAAQEVFELKYKPQLNLLVNGGLNGNYIPDFPKRFGWSAGLGFSVYIFDGKQKEINRNKTVLAVQTASNYKTAFLNQNGLRTARITDEILFLQNRQRLLDAQINDYQKLLSVYRSELVRGQISVLNLVTTLKDLTTLQQDFITIQVQQQLLINAYNYWNWQ